jgi:ABC-type transport system involved in cytochrome c biogenesis permease subunit
MSTTTAEPTAAGAGDRNPFAQLVHGAVSLLKPLASLRLTVALFVLSVLLVFFGTLAQMHNGIWTVVDQYFWSWFVWVDGQLLLDFGKVFFWLSPGLNVLTFTVPAPLQSTFGTTVPLGFPLPAGKLLGLLMLINLTAAHAVRFKLTWKRAGVWVLHAGLVLLFVGEAGTRLGQVEQRMKINEGQSSNYAFDTRHYELAFVDRSDPAVDHVTVVPASLLQRAYRSKERVSDPALPVDFDVTDYMVNSELADPVAGSNPATAGVGLETGVQPKSEVNGVDQTQTIDAPAAYVRLYKKGTDEPIGTYLVSIWFDLMKNVPRQTVEAGGKPYDLSLRFTRYYKPFSLHLIDFRFDRYIGTEKAKNYSSHLRLIDPERGEDRDVLISMNDPLRYRGETFYQSSFDAETEKTTELQVVRNPVWWMPYLACSLVIGGMLIHFGYYLIRFLMRTLLGSKTPAGAAPAVRAAARPRLTWGNVLVPWAVFALLVLSYVPYLKGTTPSTKLDLGAVARIPVVKDGRVKPLDTVARVDMRLMTHSEQFKDNDGKLRPAIQWFLDAASSTSQAPGHAPEYKLFRIDNDQVRNLLGLKPRAGFRYSLKEIISEPENYKSLREAVVNAKKVPQKERDLFQNKVLELWGHIGTYHEVWQGESPMMLPPGDGREWRAPASAEDQVQRATLRAIAQQLGFMPTSREALLKVIQDMPQEERIKLSEAVDKARNEALEQDEAAAAWRGVLEAYRGGDQGKLNAAVAKFQSIDAESVPAGDVRRARFETFLNGFAPFFHCLVLYAIVGLLCLAGWISAALKPGLGEGFRRTAFWVMFGTFLLHTFALFSRMYLMDRPLVFVTNLYSSAIFIGWASVALGLIVERLFPIGLGNLIGAVLGFATTVIAHNLAASGDTLEMMVAVLDTNFWLATHVTCVTLGYSATYVAGLVGLVYLFLGIFTNVLKKPVAVGSSDRPTELGRLIGQVMYGIVCLATLLSFTGTVLGGIWADQSWGRFWGWDPKENGAILIVVWNALILHARWAGLVKDRGTAVLTLVGNMITTWSWFGTNQLSVGLHNYGFSKTLAEGCAYTWIMLTSVIAAVVGWMLYERYLAPRPVPGRGK